MISGPKSKFRWCIIKKREGGDVDQAGAIYVKVGLKTSEKQDRYAVLFSTELSFVNSVEITIIYNFICRCKKNTSFFD